MLIEETRERRSSTEAIMKTAQYIGRVLPDGNLEIPDPIRQELALEPNTEVKVIVQRSEPGRDSEAMAEARAAVWRKLDALRERLSKMPFSLTEALLQAREEEDARL
jgi:hypothetical protein